MVKYCTRRKLTKLTFSKHLHVYQQNVKTVKSQKKSTCENNYVNSSTFLQVWDSYKAIISSSCGEVVATLSTPWYAHTPITQSHLTHPHNLSLSLNLLVSVLYNYRIAGIFRGHKLRGKTVRKISSQNSNLLQACMHACDIKV